MPSQFQWSLTPMFTVTLMVISSAFTEALMRSVTLTMAVTQCTLASVFNGTLIHRYLLISLEYNSCQIKYDIFRMNILICKTFSLEENVPPWWFPYFPLNGWTSLNSVQKWCIFIKTLTYTIVIRHLYWSFSFSYSVVMCWPIFFLVLPICIILMVWLNCSGIHIFCLHNLSLPVPVLLVHIALSLNFAYIVNQRN